MTLTEFEAMEARNSIGLMKREDARDNYGNHATAIKVLEAVLTQQPALTADVQMLTDEEIKDAIRHLYKDETALQMSIDITLNEYRAIEQAVLKKNVVVGMTSNHFETAVIDAAGGGCELCTDPDGAACFPQYGVGPHTHAAGTWKSEPTPQDQWPINYREDAENPGHGVWWCPNCGCGKPKDAE